ncbi:MAG: protein-export chaperone SecB [Alphaproteobacteria bacterium]|jgi:preprotein translocase subunit SecB|nr:protein-export chaperone SecB [Alphaproteobacteria bacterium]
MAKEQDTGNKATTANTTLPVTIHAQYIKGLSFNNPTPLASFTNETNAQPSISIGIQANAANLGGRNFEVTLEIRVDATREKAPLFNTELKYSGIVTLGDGIEENEAGALLMVQTPALLFPFARNIIANVTQNGGFPPLMLAPVDFAALYEQQKNQGDAGEKAGKPVKGENSTPAENGVDNRLVD